MEGFSLRSKKLLEAPTKFKLSDNKGSTNSHEDGFFVFCMSNFLNPKDSNGAILKSTVFN